MKSSNHTSLTFTGRRYVMLFDVWRISRERYVGHGRKEK
jgi:hypothetical protein